jgi:4-amino-4-deoxy-L-arabinose transferase-like glycosyltransferase
MRVSGELVVPRLNGETYAEKPPLYYWSALGAASLRGELDETAARIPSALSALALVFVTGAFGSRLFGRRAGVLSALALGTSWLFFQCGTAGMCDMPLALATTGAIAAIHVATSGERPRGGALVLAGACVGVSLLAKSLVGPAVVVLATVPSLVLDRTGGAPTDRRLPGLRWFALGFAAFLLVAAPWYVAVGCARGWPFLQDILLRQTVGRFFHEEEAKGSVFTYLASVPADLAPWTIFLPLAGFHAWRARTEDPARWRTLRFLLVGIACQLVFFSLSRCRITKYSLPAFPLVALWIGAALDGATTDLERRLATVPALGVSLTLGAVALVLPVFVLGRFPTFVGVLLDGVMLALLGAGMLYAVVRSSSPRGVAVALAALLAVAMGFVQEELYPAMDEIRSDRPLEDAVRTLVEPETPLASYGLGTRAYLIYYTGRLHVPIYRQDELHRWRTAAGTRTVYVLTSEGYLSSLLADSLLGPQAAVVARNPTGVGHDYVLVRLVWPR